MKPLLKHNWHPCMQMKDFEQLPLVEVVKAEGSYLHLRDGQKLIDATSSWWCKTLGHQDVRLRQALQQQAEKFEHVIFANTTNETILQLSEKLCSLTPSLDKIFYASDGSCAVEIAIKMSIHARMMEHSQRNIIVTLKNAYHGETIGALSVSDLALYKKIYSSVLFKTIVIEPPYLENETDTVWHDAKEHWEKILQQLIPIQQQITAVIVEPIVQGAAGMKMYSQDFLKCLRRWTKENDIYFIADEIMTAFGRAGKMLACDHADIEPDFLCLGKSLTAGWLPMSAVLTSSAMYELFYHDEVEKGFLHSHTFSGNVLAASVANAFITILHEENLIARANEIGNIMYHNMQAIAAETKQLVNVRHMGAIVAADLVSDRHRAGFKVGQEALHLGALLRPIGNTIYWLPPLNSHLETLTELKDITSRAITNVMSSD